MRFPTKARFKKAMEEACAGGFLTLTGGVVGEDDATYAISWIPLNDPESFSEEVRAKHAANMSKILAMDE